MVIAAADIVMSLDNVIAVAAAANGNFAMLIFGLAISIPIIVAGATVFMAIINYFPLIIWAGAAVLGWLAGELIATDPICLKAQRLSDQPPTKRLRWLFQSREPPARCLAGCSFGASDSRFRFNSGLRQLIFAAA